MSSTGEMSKSGGERLEDERREEIYEEMGRRIIETTEAEPAESATEAVDDSWDAERVEPRIDMAAARDRFGNPMYSEATIERATGERLASTEPEAAESVPTEPETAEPEPAATEIEMPESPAGFETMAASGELGDLDVSVSEAAAETEEQPEEIRKIKRNLFEKLRGKSVFKGITRSFMRRAATMMATVIVAGVMAGGLTMDRKSVPGRGTAAAAGFGAESPTAVTQMMDAEEPGSPEANSAESGADMTEQERANIGVGETAGGTTYDYRRQYLSPNKLARNNFGESQVGFYEDEQGTIGALEGICRDEPEALAATVSAYPSVLKAAGLRGNETAAQIDEMLSTGENGGQLQKSLLAALGTALRSEGRTMQFYLENGEEQTYNMTHSGDVTPENVKLVLEKFDRKDAKQVAITVPVRNENGEIIAYEVGDFNMDCGMQLNNDPKIVAPEVVVEEKAAEKVEVQAEPAPEGQQGPSEKNNNVDRPPIIVDKSENKDQGGADKNDEEPGRRDPVKDDNETDDKKDDTQGEEPGQTQPEEEAPVDKNDETEEVIKKDANNQQAVVDKGGQVGEVVPVTPGDGAGNSSQDETGGESQGESQDGGGGSTTTEEPDVSDDNAEQKSSNAVTDSDASEEQQQEDQEAQERADRDAAERESAGSMTDNELEDYINSILG